MLKSMRLSNVMVIDDDQHYLTMFVTIKCKVLVQINVFTFNTTMTIHCMFFYFCCHYTCSLVNQVIQLMSLMNDDPKGMIHHVQLRQ